jgi:hypothetical protein
MFIDENTKGIYTTSDTFGNVVYEGDLRNLSHKLLIEHSTFIKIQS